MKRSRRAIQLAAALALAASSSARAQIRVATYNIEADVNGNTAPNPGLDSVLQAMGSESVNGIARPLDIIGLEETTSNTLTVAPIVTSLNNFYGAGTYAMSPYQATEIANDPTTGNGPNALIYNTHTLTLINSVGFGTLSGSAMSRQEVRYQFRPVGYGSNADFYLYVGHYKAKGDSTSMDRRDVEAGIVRTNAGTLPAGSRIIYTGDMNITGGSSEAAWSTLTSAGTFTNGSQTVAIDPINLGGGSWNNSNSSFADAYSDSTSTRTSRLDFQLNTPPTMDGHGFSFITGSYHVFGNNGGTNSYNKSVTNSANTFGTPTLRSDILSASDHYSVVADYRLPALIGVTLPTRVIGGVGSIAVIVSNAAPVQVAAGADTLAYSLTTSGSLSGSGSGSGLAALGAGSTNNINVTSATPGAIGTITVSSTSQEVSTVSQSVTVLAHAHPTIVSAGGQGISRTIDFGTRAQNSAALGLGTPSASFAVQNLSDPSGFSSKLDLDSILGSGSTSALTTNLGTFMNLAAAGSINFSATMNTASFGSFSATYTLNLSDEDLPGAAATAPMTLTLTGRIAMAGDADVDGAVNALDFNTLATHFGQAGQTWSGADFNADGVVNTIDFTALAQNFGSSYNPTPAASLATLIPEPQVIAVSCLMIFGFVRRNRHNPLFRLK